MSLSALTAVWEHSQQKGSELLVLLALADYANENDMAWPRISTLAGKARLSERSVQYALSKLEDAGEVVRVREGKKTEKGYVTAAWRLTLRRGAESAPVEVGVQNGAARGANQRDLGVQPVAPRTVRDEPSEEPSEDAREETQIGFVVDGGEERGRPKWAFRAPGQASGKRVDREEWRVVLAVVDAFREFIVGAEKIQPTKDNASRVVQRLRQGDAPLDPTWHVELVRRNAQVPWWTTPVASVGIFYSAGQLQKAIVCDGVMRGRMAREHAHKKQMEASAALQALPDDGSTTISGSYDPNDPTRGFF